MAFEKPIDVAYPIDRLAGEIDDSADLASEGATMRLRTAAPSDAILLAGRSAGDLGVLFRCST